MSAYHTARLGLIKQTISNSTLTGDPVQAFHIEIIGIVQGVGFRPRVYNLAREFALQGWVRNTSHGLEIEVQGSRQALESFVSGLKSNPPSQASIQDIRINKITPIPAKGFLIRESHSLENTFQPLSPDIATCRECLSELNDSCDRRWHYPFINCTNCGPRFTIIEDVPYDRKKTTMGTFQMCPDCKSEYDDPANRRFHAQPNACFSCGPHIWLEESDESSKGINVFSTQNGALKNIDAIRMAAERL